MVESGGRPGETPKVAGASLATLALLALLAWTNACASERSRPGQGVVESSSEQGVAAAGAGAAIGAAAAGGPAGAAASAAPGDPPQAGALDAQAPAGDARQRPRLCDRPGDDRVRDLFCAEAPPPIASLADLLRPLGLVPEQASLRMASDMMTIPVLTAHSTSLSGHVVSPINPRAILLGIGPAGTTTPHVIVAFQRGVQQVEIVAVDRGDQHLNFYLVSFRQACNAAARGCLPGDLYTPRVEADWLAVSVQDDEDLKDTRFDCRQCHKRGRPAPALLMRELISPWTHFFGPDQDADRADGFPGVTGGHLLRDYMAAKGDEAYGGLPGDVISDTAPIFLEHIAGAPQPLLFDAPRIFEERWPQGTDGYPATPSRSATWDDAYAAFKRGEQLALPYFAERVTDPEKQARLTQAYQRYRSGELSAEDLPDLADIFPDDPQLRAEIGLQTEPGASPAEALVQACGPCHNDVLDQTLSRARFNIALARLDAAARGRAIERLELAPDDVGVMPPPEARQLDPQTRPRLIEYLRQSARPPEDDALLESAAALGMAGGAQPPPGVGASP